VDPDQLRRTALARLRSHGPATPSELVRALELDHDVTPADLDRTLVIDAPEDESAFPLRDGRLCDLGGLIEGVTLTHVLTPEERDAGVVDLQPDLSPAHLVSPDGRTFPLDGGGDHDLELDHHGLTAPRGWLPEEDVLVLRIVDGRVAISGLDTVPEVDTTTAARLADTLAALRAQHARPIDEVELLIDVRARYPKALSTPQAPLRDLLAAEGLAATDRGVVTAEEAENDEAPKGELIGHLRDEHGLDDEQIGAILAVDRYVLELRNQVLRASVAAMREALEAGEELDRGRPTAVEREELAAALTTLDLDAAPEHLARALDDVAAAMAVVEDVLEDDFLAAASLLGVLDRVRPASKARDVRANTAWVRARALELVADDHAEAERELRRARELDPDHGAAAFDLVGYLSDRGQAGAALGLLHQIEGPGVADRIELLGRYAKPGPTSAGRNDPCPCGSGRKHKVCCAPRNGWPLAERMPWVMHKLMAFYGSGRAREVVLDVARASGMADTEGSYRDTAALNLALFEGGVIGDLCDVRGSLLPADELELLRAWSQVRAGPYALVEAGDDGTCVLSDLRTLERTTFVDRSLASTLDVGDTVLAWLVEQGDRTVPFYGVVPVPDDNRAELLEVLGSELSATGLAAWLRDLHTPPELVTTGGDVLVSVERTYAVPDAEAARAALADHLEEDEDDGKLRAFEERDGTRWLKGSVEVAESQLVVSTMSVPRAVWFGELIERVVPEAELVDEQQLPVSDLLARHEREATAEEDD
jgi:hypothetical protein